MSWKDKIKHKGNLPEKGNTIYVFGHCLTEPIIRQYFEKYGKIFEINITKCLLICEQLVT